MPRRILMLGTVLATIGCAAASIVPPTQFSGQWGGDLINVYDSVAAHGLVLSTGCGAAMFPAPVELDSAGGFLAFGAFIRAAYRPDIGRRVRISGHVTGNVVALDAWVAPLDRPDSLQPSVRFILTRGQPPNWDELICTA